MRLIWALRMLVTMVVFLGSWLGAPDRAEAKSPMCGDSAESIAAPPPLVAARNTVAQNCADEVDLALGAIPSGDPNPRLASAAESTQQLGLLPQTSSVRQFRSSSSWPLSESTWLELGEHRWNQPRPPSLG